MARMSDWNKLVLPFSSEGISENEGNIVAQCRLPPISHITAYNISTTKTNKFGILKCGLLGKYVTLTALL